MKVLRTLIIGVLASTVFLACKKESASSPSQSAKNVEGIYTGKYGFDNETPDVDYKLNIKSGGVIQELSTSSGNPTGQGTWSLNGNTLTATYSMLFAPFNKYSIVATFDESTKKLTGTWGFDNNGTDGGKISMNKN